MMSLSAWDLHVGSAPAERMGQGEVGGFLHLAEIASGPFFFLLYTYGLRNQSSGHVGPLCLWQ